MAYFEARSNGHNIISLYDKYNLIAISHLYVQVSHPHIALNWEKSKEKVQWWLKPYMDRDKQICSTCTLSVNFLYKNNTS